MPQTDMIHTVAPEENAGRASATEKTGRIDLPGNLAAALRSEGDAFLRCLRDALRPKSVSLTVSHGTLLVTGDEDSQLITARVLEYLAEDLPKFLRSPPEICHQRIRQAVDFVLQHDLAFRLSGLHQAVRPMGVAQLDYMTDLLSADEPLVLGVGPAGTGKTHLALSAAIHLLAADKVKHIVVTRPHVIIDGQLLTAPVRWEIAMDEQFMPIIDILTNLISFEAVAAMRESREIELVPTGLLRGRTFNDSIVLIDEAQNLTVNHLRMAATRVGLNSRLFITGDPAQCDLKTGEASGLSHFVRLLENKDLGKIHKFEPGQVVRSDLARNIECLYAEHEQAISPLRRA